MPATGSPDKRPMNVNKRDEDETIFSPSLHALALIDVFVYPLVAGMARSYNFINFVCSRPP